MSVEKVLITGVNGFIGYATVIQALKSGYNVVAAVRRQSAIDHVLRGVSAKQFFDAGNLTFEIIPDMTLQDAFVQPAVGCSVIMHVASPLGHVAGDLHSPAHRGVEALLHAAEVVPTVRRTVWTGSMAGLVPFSRFLVSDSVNQVVASSKDEDLPFLTGDSVAEDPKVIPDDKAPGMERYSAGKIAATNKLRRYASERSKDTSLSFDIVIISPGWVLGPSEIQQTQEEAFDGLNTNSVLLFMFTPLYRLNTALGVPENEHAPLVGCQLHIDDCAEAHVNAMKVEFQGKLRSYLLASDGPYGAEYEDAIPIIRQRFPDVAEKIIPNAHFGTIKQKFDATGAEKELLGHKFKSYEQAVIDTVEWYRQLPAKAKAQV